MFLTIYRILARKRCIVELGRIDPVWDENLNYLMDQNIPVQVGSCTATFINGDKRLLIWIGNFPYSYGYINNGDKKMPFLGTRKRLDAYLSEIKHKEFIDND